MLSRDCTLSNSRSKESNGTNSLTSSLSNSLASITNNIANSLANITNSLTNSLANIANSLTSSLASSLARGDMTRNTLESSSPKKVRKNR